MAKLDWFDTGEAAHFRLGDLDHPGRYVCRSDLDARAREMQRVFTRSATQFKNALRRSEGTVHARPNDLAQRPADGSVRKSHIVFACHFVKSSGIHAVVRRLNINPQGCRIPSPFLRRDAQTPQWQVRANMRSCGSTSRDPSFPHRSVASGRGSRGICRSLKIRSAAGVG